MNTGLRSLCAAACVLAATPLTPAFASGPEDARGLWLSAAEDAVLDFQPCADKPGALCGRIVWDKDAGTPKAACGVLVAQLARPRRRRPDQPLRPGLQGQCHQPRGLGPAACSVPAGSARWASARQAAAPTSRNCDTDCTSCWALSGSVPRAKVTVSVITPSVVAWLPM